MQEKYGHFMVNKVNKTLERGNRLGRLDEFCGRARKQYLLFKEGSPCQLTEDKVDQLREMGFCLERSQAHRYSLGQQQQKASSTPRRKEEEGAAIGLGQLRAPKIDDDFENGGKSGDDVAEGGDGAMLCSAKTDMVSDLL